MKWLISLIVTLEKYQKKAFTRSTKGLQLEGKVSLAALLPATKFISRQAIYQQRERQQQQQQTALEPVKSTGTGSTTDHAPPRKTEELYIFLILNCSIWALRWVVTVFLTIFVSIICSSSQNAAIPRRLTVSIR